MGRGPGAGLGNSLELGLGGQGWGAPNGWGWRLLQGAGAVRANPTNTEPSSAWAAQNSSWEHPPALEASKEQGGHQGPHPKRPEPPITPGVVQRDQVNLVVSPPGVLEAPGAVTDSHNNSALPHFVK